MSAAVVHVGIDLAWNHRARTGLAVVDAGGALLASGSAGSDDELDAWLGEHCRGDVGVVAVDAPLIVRNPTGARTCERLVTSAFGRYDAGCYPSNTGMAYMNPPRAAQLAERHGWRTDPGVPPIASCIEVYPHAAMVGLFALGRTLKYKKGRVDTRRPALLEALRHIESIASLQLTGNERWRRIESTVQDATRPMHLDAVEDEVDAVLCAHLAWLWANHRESLHVYGDADGGYIVAPGTAR